MLNITAAEIAKSARGTVLTGTEAVSVETISTDTRTITPGSAFVALRGERFDGHEYARAAVEKGAVVLVVDAKADPGSLPGGVTVVVVTDTLRALGDMAAWVRAESGVPVVAVSGSAGKTTTRELAASILERSRCVLKPERNFNNLVGLPLTLLGLRDRHEAAVVELGISVAGEMERLVEIAHPDVAVLTNIGPAHLETLGSVEGVARAKAPLFSMLGPEAVRVVNLDDPLLESISGAVGPGSVVTFSAERKADVRLVRSWQEDDLAGSGAVYDVRGETIAVHFAAAGVSYGINGASAIAACLPLEVTTDEIVVGLESFSPMKGRLEVIRTPGLTIIDDTYNANPASVTTALSTLCASKGAHRRVAVLGTMLELGGTAGEAHGRVGRTAGEMGTDVVVGIGEYSGHVVEGAMEGGLGAGDVHAFADKGSAIDALSAILRDGDVVLVKGSRGEALEEVVDALRNQSAERVAGAGM